MRWRSGTRAARATLVAAHHASARGDGFDRCSPLNEIRVPLGTTRLEIESFAGTRVDRDALDLACVPVRTPRRLPRVDDAHAPRNHGATDDQER
jgi:hypothetical protein